MIWPSDRSRREQLVTTAAVTDMRTAFSNVDVPAQWFELAAEAKPLSDVRSSASAPFVRGLIAGHILIETLGHVQLDLPFSMSAAVRLAIKPFCYKTREWKLTAKTVENYVWPTFRPVAHFWAASIDRIKSGEDSKFPCSYRKLADYLSFAEGYRVLGESSSTFKSRNNILRAEESARLPPAIERQIVPAALEFFVRPAA